MISRVVAFLFFFILLLSGCAGNRIIERSKGIGKKGTFYHFLAGELAALSGKMSEALREIDKAIAELPEEAYLHYKRAALLGTLGQIDEASLSAHRALELDPDNYQSLILLGKIYQSQGEREKSNPLYLKARRLSPDIEEVSHLLLESYLADKRYQEAIGLLKEWEEKKPDDPTPLYYEASLYENFLKNIPMALKSYQRVRELEPNNLKVLMAMAGLYLSSGQPARAAELFSEIEKQAPGDMTLQLQLAILYYDTKQYDKAIQKFQEILAEYPQSDRLIYYLGVIYENVKKDAEAVIQFSKITPRSPFFKDAVLHHAFVLHRGGKPEEAEAFLRKGIREKKSEGTFYEYLADLLRQRGGLDEAIAVLEEGIRRAERKESLHYALGSLYEKKGNLEEGIRQMRHVLEINPENANALNFIGYSYADRGIRLGEAREMIQKALQIKPNDGFIVDSLGWVYFKQGNLDQALTLLTRAWSLVAKEPTIAEHLGDVYLSKGDKGKALKFFRESLTMLKGRKEGKDDRERLEKKIQGLRSR